MKFKYKFLLLLIAISLVGCLYVSQSYAFWMVTKEQNTANQITSGCFNISFSDTGSNSINLNNTYPVNDTLGLSQNPYEFTITNACTIAASYTVTLSSLNTNGIDDSKIKYAIYRKSGTEGAGTKPPNGTLLGSNSVVNNSLKIDNLKKTYNIGNGTLKGGTRNSSSNTVTNGGTATYDLYLWIDEKTTDTEAAGKTFAAEVDVVSTAA